MKKWNGWPPTRRFSLRGPKTCSSLACTASNTIRAANAKLQFLKVYWSCLIQRLAHSYLICSPTRCRAINCPNGNGNAATCIQALYSLLPSLSIANVAGMLFLTKISCKQPLRHSISLRKFPAFFLHVSFLFNVTFLFIPVPFLPPLSHLKQSLAAESACLRVLLTSLEPPSSIFRTRFLVGVIKDPCNDWRNGCNRKLVFDYQ